MAASTATLLLLFESGVDLVPGGRRDAEARGNTPDRQVGADGVAVELVEGVAASVLDVGEPGLRRRGPAFERFA